MLETLRRSLGERWARFTLRKAKDEVISFSGSLSDAEHVLLLMPLDHREMLSTMEVIAMIRKRFEPANISIVGDEQALEAMRLLPQSHFIHIRDGDINPFYLARPSLLQRIKSRRYDVAIDLNLDLVLPSAYICKESNARVRVGFARNRAGWFYNFQVQPDPTLSRKLVYDRLAKCLEMF